MGRDVLELREIDRTQVAAAGGKGAHLGELSRLEGVHVPPGLCVTTDAFERIVTAAPAVATRLDALSRLGPDAHEALRARSAELRRVIERIAIPDALAAAMERALARHDRDAAFAVRSSATAEDSPTASFAGQHDTYLQVVGLDAILAHVRRCWASLFSERAVAYRLHEGIDHRTVRMAVVVQRMVDPEAAGVLFTADPLTGNRTVAAVEAVAGLGEALVSGVANADVFAVRAGAVVSRTRRQPQPTLTDEQVVRLVALGRRIEAHFGRPQDIEWCSVDDDFQIVQSRPITTLFPIPERDDAEPHVYVSVGHQQMMTDPFTPLGISMWQLAAGRPMFTAGGRLFVDVARELASPATRGQILMLGKSDPLIGDALQTLVDRGFVAPLADASSEVPPSLVAAAAAAPPLEPDPAIVDALIARSEASLAALQREIAPLSGTALLDFIRADIVDRNRERFDPQSMRVLMTGMQAAWWLDEHLQEWLGEKRAADTLTLSAPNNVTSEMGLALLDVADVVREHPEVVAFLERTEDDAFMDALPSLAGGREARDAIEGWLERYGMRGVGEIDITRPRWSERPLMLLPTLLGNVRHFAPGAAAQRFEQGRLAAWRKEKEVLARLRALQDGETKAAETKQMIDRVRAFSGYREYPKYAMIRRQFVYKRALLQEAERLVRAGVLRERDDVFFLTFQELRDVVATQRADERLIREREADFASYQALTPPRVLTSEGEAVSASYRRSDLPAGALVGLPVSAGVVEGRARVIHDVAHAALEPGDVLVTTFTDPSWTPLFVGIAGLVTEVGGLMTHGAVIAREYGLPAVVGVEHATRRIRDGQRIRIHGTDGYVELLS